MKHTRRISILAAAVVATLGLTVAVPASASTSPPGVYRTAAACYTAGDAGVAAGQWSNFDCEPLLTPSGKPMHLWFLHPNAFS